MNPKLMNFWTYSWFISTLICLIMQGVFWGSTQVADGWDLSLFTTYDVAGLFDIPVINPNFWQTILHILTWDYSFYTGPYSILRYFWLCALTPGAVWGFYEAFTWVQSSLVSLFRII